MKKSIHGIFLFVALFLLRSELLLSQYSEKSLEAFKTLDAPKLDGLLNDACWVNAPKTSGFIINRPTPGKPLPQETEVQIVYTDDAMYIGFMNYDNAPDSILQQLSGRDGDGNTDYVGVTFSCYRDGINGFTFSMTPTGEQWDARLTNSGDEDVSWNAVWDGRCRIVENGWIAEFKIPFAAIRFPDSPEQIWDINFFREVRRNREIAFWSPIDPGAAGQLVRMGTLTGIKNIKPPTRIFLTPYASFYHNIAEQSIGKAKHESSWNVGADLKLGLNDAFTLDATLIPDFGQVISDQQILNLTPFEVQFQDNRQFFIEGTELFSKAGIFYTRRIGYLPDGYSPNISLNEGERITSLPFQQQLLNASKISGRNAKGLGIGFFNAVTAKSEAVITNSEGQTRSVELYPVTNYNVTVLDQNLKNNSSVSIINTNALRLGNTYDANVTGTQFDFRNKKNTFSINGSGAYNIKYGGIYEGDKRNNDGFTQNINFNKISGNFIFSLGQSMESDTYDPTDLGFLQANNSRNQYLWMQYRTFEPFWKLNSISSSFLVDYNRLYAPNEFTSLFLASESFINTKKFTTYFINLFLSPVRGQDFFEPRTEGLYFNTFRNSGISGWISTDYRKPLAIDAGAGYTSFENEGRFEYNWRFAPRMRFSDKLFVVFVYRQSQHFNDLGYATRQSDGAPIFGRRNVVTHTNTLTVNYSFNPLMTILCRVRHYWGFSKYKEFFGLDQSGELTTSSFEGFINESGETLGHSVADRSFNSFTIDFIYRWIFVPGSEVSIVWKNDITKADFGVPIPRNLWDDLDYNLGLPQNNNFSIRCLYFLDYHSLKRKKSRGGATSSTL